MAKKLNGASRAVGARERARLARHRVDAERMRRDHEIEESVAGFFQTDERRAALLAQVEETERSLGEHIRDLVALKQSRARIATMLDIDTKEVGRLLRLADGDTGGDATETDPVSVAGDVESPLSPERDGAPVSVSSGTETH